MEKVFSGNYDMCILAGSQGHDSDILTNCVGTDGGLNVSFYSNEEVDSLLARCASSRARLSATALYKQVQTESIPAKSTVMPSIQAEKPLVTLGGCDEKRNEMK